MTWLCFEFINKFYVFHDFIIYVKYVDIYLICRIFVDYDTDKMHYMSYKKFYGPSKQNNIIIYAGDVHSELYRDFFVYLKSYNLLTKRSP